METLQVLSDRIMVVADRDATGGTYEVFDVTGPDGGGPPPHSHPWAETFLVLAGEVDVLSGQDWRRLQAGETVTIPAGDPHAFRYVGNDSRFVAVTEGGRASGLFRELDRRVGIPQGDDDIATVIEIALSHGLTPADAPAPPIA